MHTSDDLDQQNLGQLFVRACQSLHHSPPAALTQALQDQNPLTALRELIVLLAAATTACAPHQPHPATTNPTPPHHQIKTTQHFSTNIDVSRCLHAIATSRSPTVHLRVAQTLAPHTQHARQRQAQRQSVREEQAATLFSAGALPPVIQRKLAAPHQTPLTSQQSVQCIQSCVHYGTTQAQQAQGHDTIVVLGNTGAGKSCFVNLLQGCTFERSDQDRMVVSMDSVVPEVMQIGHTNKSQTFAPQVVEVTTNVYGLKGIALADCPGFLDNRGFEINIANAVNIQRTIAAAATVRIVVIINYFSIMADRGKGIQDLFRILSAIFGTANNAQTHAKSILLAISQAPVLHPETGLPMSLNQLRARLLDPSGLDEQSATLLEAIPLDHVFCFHLLGAQRKDIDSSWLTIQAIADRINTLVPIMPQQHGALFHSCIDDSDKTRIRQLVEGIGDKMKTAIVLGAYDMAVDLAQDVLDMKQMVDNAFMTAVVDDTLQAAVVGPDAVAVILGLAGGTKEEEEQQGTEKEKETEKDTNNDEKEQANTFARVRWELQRIAASLIAFAGIKQIRDALVAVLIKGMREFEEAMQHAETLVGQKTADRELQQVVRMAGDNIVKECWLLPKSKDTIRVRQCQELHQLHANMERNKMDILAQERDAIEIRKLTYRFQATNEAWQEHYEHAIDRMAQHDRFVLSSENEGGGASHFWLNVGGSPKDLLPDGSGESSSNQQQTLLNWNYKGLDERDCEVMAAELRRLKGSNIHRLFISGNRIGDEGATALAHALAFGALPQLQRFHAQNNTVGDVGFGNIAVQIGEGRLEHLTLLDLSRNAISNESMHMLAGALVGKDHQVLQHLQTLYLTSNKIGCAGVTSFAKAVASNNRILPQLKILWFNRNQIKDVGVASFHAAISAGALGLLKELMFQGNEANVLLTKAVSETLDARGGEMINEEHRVLEENQYDSMRGL